MAQGKSRGLELPPQEKPDRESFSLRRGKVLSWVADLPVGNIGETTRLLYQALHETNRYRHSWRRRYHFLESIRQPLHQVQQALSRHYVTQGLPLQAKTQQIATLAQRLYTEMAIGYKAAIEDMLSAWPLFQSRRALRIMLHRAVRYLSLNLLTSYQIYTQQYSGSWRELHHLYSYAAKHHIHRKLIKDVYSNEQQKSSIEQLYKQIALLATTSPFSLRQGEAAAIQRQLMYWSNYTELLAADNPAAKEALFVVHLENDHEPDYHAFDRVPCLGPQCMLLDTRELAAHLQETASHQAHDDDQLITSELLNRLIHTWGGTPHRGETRSPSGSAVHVVVGMTHLHHLLVAPLHDESMEAHHSHYESRAVPAASPIASKPEPPNDAGDVWNIYAPRRATPPPPPRPKAEVASTKPSDQIDIQRWELRNESPGGYRLAIPDQQHSVVRVGELVAIRAEAGLDRWQLAVIRWIRHFPHTGLETGVQLIAPQMVAIMVKNVTPGKEKGEAQRGLLLPAHEEFGIQATLIVPNRIFLPQDRVLIHVPHNEFEALLGNVLQESGTFVQFEFSTAPPLAPGENVAKKPSRSASPFDKLWGQL